MAHQIHKLTALQVRQTKKPGRYNDGGGLYFYISEGNRRRWIFRYRDRNTGKLRDMGLGSVTTVTLAVARGKAANARELLTNGKDPITSGNSAGTATPTFQEMMDDVLPTLEKGWRNAKHRQQWRNTLTTHAASILKKPVDSIQTSDVLDILKPLWASIPETASRVRGRIEKILDAAKANGHRSGENPARWRGHLDIFLPKPKKLTRGHHPAMPYAEIPDFMTRLPNQKGVAPLALEFTILTAARSKECREGTWHEIDFDQELWTIPAIKMKAEKDHRVPLTSHALTVLHRALELRRNDLIFPGMKQNRPLSDMTLAAVLKRMKITNVTVHGFRSTFKDWATDCTEFPNELSEMALAHTVGSNVERAYRRGDALRRRRALMDEWTNYLMKNRS